MGKITVVPTDAEAKKKFKGVRTAVEDYFNTADMDKLKGILLDIFDLQKNLNQCKKAFATHKKTVLALKPLFKQFVLEQNNAAKKDGCKNYLEFAANCDGLPWEKFKLFLEKVDLVIKDLNQKFPEPPSEWADWYWSKYSIPDAPYLVTKERYTVPDDILKMIKKKAPEIATILPKIEIQKLKDFYPSARYDKKKKKVIISTPFRRTGICGALTFVHEIAHAVVMLDYAKKGVDTLNKSKYWHEKKGLEVESGLVKKLFSKKIHEAWLARFLGSFCRTFFEYEIYNHPERNFDRAFARANNRCYLKANQCENPFYVLHRYFISRPGYSAMTSVAITELLLEGKV